MLPQECIFKNLVDFVPLKTRKLSGAVYSSPTNEFVPPSKHYTAQELLKGKILRFLGFARGKLDSELRTSGLICIKPCYPRMCISHVVIIFQTMPEKLGFIMWTCNKLTDYLTRNKDAFQRELQTLQNFAVTQIPLFLILKYV